jgi:nitroreductase
MEDRISHEIMEARKPEHEIHPIILNRWSARAMSGEGLSDDELMPLFEAAKWAPSSNNSQEWRFIYAKRDSADWQKFFGLMTPGNQEWVKNAAVLVVVISKTISDYNGKFMRTHSFDAGAAWENLALEGTRRGLVVHAMGGFDYDLARKSLEIPEEYSVECVVAIGRRGRKEELSERLAERERPSDRRPLKETIMEGKFSA